ncbi:MAG: trypsin-like peptidase domain-containing protein [Planctomycetes bacterium]|nr:trypsin-like peptidase domain-containing protein [Planctomycetota bacterium]
MRLLLALLILPGLLRADVFKLTDGREVKGPLLKETADSYFVDLGQTVLELPKKSVLAREAEGAPGEAAPEKATKAEDQIWSAIDRPEASVKANVERTAAAVVMVRQPHGLGSGFIISPDGYVITNDHVIQGETKISVVLFEKGKDGTLNKRIVEKVRIVATNAYEDLALLKLEGETDLPITYLGDSDEVRAGQSCYAIGNPHGLERTVSEGIVSTLNRVMDGRTHLQITAAVNPGNSGGPLFNLKGEVIGVVDLKLIFSEGLNFAIPVDRVKRFLRDRDAFAYDKDNPNTGYTYLPPPPKKG